MLNPDSLITLGPTTAESLRLSWPDDHEYDARRAAWNLAVDQRPACVCVATNVEQVQADVAYARASRMQALPVENQKPEKHPALPPIAPRASPPISTLRRPHCRMTAVSLPILMR